MPHCFLGCRSQIWSPGWMMLQLNFGDMRKKLLKKSAKKLQDRVFFSEIKILRLLTVSLVMEVILVFICLFLQWSYQCLLTINLLARMILAWRLNSDYLVKLLPTSLVCHLLLTCFTHLTKTLGANSIKHFTPMEKSTSSS